MVVSMHMPRPRVPGPFQIPPNYTFNHNCTNSTPRLAGPDGPEPAVPGTLRPSDVPITDQAKGTYFCTSDRSQHLLPTHRNWARASPSIDIPLAAAAGSLRLLTNTPPKPALPKS